MKKWAKRALIVHRSLLSVGGWMLGGGICAAQTTSSAPAEPPRATGSLWSNSSINITSDFRARRVGDIVTVIVTENTSGSSSATTKASRKDAAKFDGVTGALSGVFQTVGIKKSLLGPLGASASNSVDGQGQTNRTGSINTQLTVVVKEVLPNGNLVIEGTRDVGINKETQKVTVTGTIRPQDITPQNTVSSVAMANATVKLDGKGIVADRQRKGLLATVFGWLF